MHLFRNLLFSIALLLPAWAAAADRPLKIVSLHPVLTEFAAAIAGDEATVQGLVPGGVDVHSFEPAPKQVAAARAADLVLATGLHLEGYLDRIASADGAPDRVLRVGERLPFPREGAPCDDDHNGGARAPHTHGENDPHWWHGIHNALFVSDLLRAELTRLRPAAAEGFSRRAQLLQQRLFALQSWAASEVRTLPQERRHLFTTHDAFGYLARDFGFSVHPLSGLSTESEPNARRVSALVDEVRRLGIKAVFAEDSASSRLIQTLATETKVTLAPSLYADGPGAPGSGVETYEAMYRFNLSTIVAALRK
jgi:ABC-type Zn uptake system ZnuABC Zn-binding protein ZnuA